MTDVSTEQFTYDHAEQMFVGEVSTIGDFLRDLAFVLCSPWSGQRIAMEVTREYAPDDGFTLWWDLRPAEPRERARGIRARVYNDKPKEAA